MTTSTPNDGSPSRTGSNTARTFPARMLMSRRVRALAAKRSVSSASLPSDFTTRAPSKDSCAISLSSARRACTLVISGDWKRWKIRLLTITSGNTIRPTIARTASVITIWATAMTIIATVPTAMGRGAIGAHAASTSEFALESSSPVGCCWCQASGRRRYCRVTLRRSWDCIRYCMTPAPQRRATMLDPAHHATPTKSATTATMAAAGTTPLERRQHDVVGRPAEDPGVGDGEGTEEDRADGRDREHPGLAPDRDAEDRETARKVPVRPAPKGWDGGATASPADGRSAVGFGPPGRRRLHHTDGPRRSRPLRRLRP